MTPGHTAEPELYERLNETRPAAQTVDKILPSKRHLAEA